MAYPGFGAYGGYSGQMPGMQMTVGQPMPGAVPNMPHGGYSGYSAYSGTYSAAADPMWTYFAAIAGQCSVEMLREQDARNRAEEHEDGEVDAEELQRCLTQSGISGTYSPFSLETCRIMISLMDRDYTGKMGFNEFKELWAALNAWKQNFMMIDQDRSGTVELHELGQVIAAMGYRLSPQTLTAIVKRYSKNGKIFFDDYVACCVKLRALTDFFRRRDNMQQGYVNFVYDDFLQCTMAI
ncbi:grancalcin isoform X2 [Trachemys scripta elegans]|uniref:Grancalcin n=2 Tax=Emydidae TaxID=8476 RepID=A0A8C3PF53_CHRPI|nr:grancalcin isoform X2 [Chrysemys picta bellii]XP_024060062.1 grancalcin isoform X1 [Terrapene carolina triunguis]XP_034642205.1 grancalcin isoform X2 [Trachemys scripta elegans]XP_053900073.1 grancalcin isoform X1 [Malaclemys terrapin pileata]